MLVSSGGFQRGCWREVYLLWDLFYFFKYVNIINIVKHNKTYNMITIKRFKYSSKIYLSLDKPLTKKKKTIMLNRSTKLTNYLS